MRPEKPPTWTTHGMAELEEKEEIDMAREFLRDISTIGRKKIPYC
jgi:hypothetical protein